MVESNNDQMIRSNQICVKYVKLDQSNFTQIIHIWQPQYVSVALPPLFESRHAVTSSKAAVTIEGLGYARKIKS